MNDVLLARLTEAHGVPGQEDAIRDIVKSELEGVCEFSTKIMDSSLICHPKVVEHFRRLAEKHKIPHPMEILSLGGTDAGGVQRLHGGIPAFTQSIPTRYVHTVNETVHEDDVDACVDLLARYIEDSANGEHGYEQVWVSGRYRGELRRLAWLRLVRGFGPKLLALGIVRANAHPIGLAGVQAGDDEA